MPHAAAREARSARAAARGYLRRSRAGVRFLEVPAALHEKAKVMMKSLELHRAHSGVCGHSTHYARDATIGARSVIGEQAFAMSMKTHQEANTAKHNVDNDDGDDNVTVLLSLARPIAALVPCVGSPDGKLISNLVTASAQEKVLLQRMVESQNNLLLRVRQTERLIQETSDASKAIEARLGAAVAKMETVTRERCGGIVEKSLASVVPITLRSVTEIGQVYDHDIKALRNVVEELRMDRPQRITPTPPVFAAVHPREMSCMEFYDVARRIRESRPYMPPPIVPRPMLCDVVRVPVPPANDAALAAARRDVVSASSGFDCRRFDAITDEECSNYEASSSWADELDKYLEEFGSHEEFLRTGNVLFRQCEDTPVPWE